MENFKSKIFEGRVFHQRLQPKKHRLSYKLYSLLFDLDELPALDKSISIFSWNKFNILSFWDKDFGDKAGANLRGYVEGLLSNAGILTNGGAIKLLCYPRLFGFVFNPLSVYFCYDQEETLKAIIYEVSNTFGERHSYLIEVEDGQEKSIRQTCEKGFYVSPFIEMDATYHFNILPPKERVSVAITQTNAMGVLLKACFTGKAVEITNKSLVAMVLKYPLMTLKVVAGIHWEALKIWSKGIKYVKRPQAPINSVTHIQK